MWVVIIMTEIPVRTMKNFRISVLLVITLVVFLFTGCSTQKDRFVNRAYHSINAKYNGFFNARESYREGLKRLAELHTDNYENILSIFTYGTEQDAASVGSNMDIAYEKASLVIRRHSMDIRGVEHNKWIDESYYLIARSHFFKRDYTLAIITFEYIIRKYDTQRSHDSKAWIAKCYHEQERFEQAQRMLELLENYYDDGLLSDETTALFRKTYADHYIRQERYGRAAEQLQKGIPYVKGRHERVRLTFIQAQLYQHAADFPLAQETYRKVLDMRPNYQMAFQARIGMAMAYDPSVGGSGFIRNELLDMLSEDRNKVFRDQIYYALAQLAMRQDDQQEAIRLYTLSYESSEDNDFQKALSFLRLGEIFFDQPDYLKSANYYDSTTTYMPRSHEDYELIRNRHMVLTRLTQQVRIIEHEDSLQRLAAMTPEQQKAVAEQIIADLLEEERRLAEEERARAAAMRDAGRMARETRGMGEQDRGWYFYNSNAMANGEMEFFSRFGDRKLEDLWRISNKQMLAGDFDMGFDDFEEEEPEEELDAHDPETYLRNIPNTDEQMENSMQRKIQAYYNMAMLFKDPLRDIDNAIGAFNDMLVNFSGHPLEMHAFYYLYHLYREINDHSMAEAIKNQLVDKYPDSEYAMIIGDPNYRYTVMERQNLVNRLYTESYNAFFAGRYELISRNMRALDTLDAPRTTKAQFAYLNALAAGKSDDNHLFRNELQYVVDQYVDTPVHEPASFLLASLELTAGFDPDEMYPDEPGRRRRTERPAIESPFDFSPDEVHFFIVIVNAQKTDPNSINNAITAFQNEQFEEKELSTSNIFFETGKQLITVTNFPDMETGMNYFRVLMESETFNAEQITAMDAFIISVNNYPSFYQEKELEDYRYFFDYYYLEM